MADVITGQPKSVAVAAPSQWGVATRKYAVEAIGAFFLAFVVAAGVLSGSVFTPLAAGATLMVMIYAGGHISGGHYNPAVTLAVLVRGRIGIRDAVAYWIAQVVGGLSGGAFNPAVTLGAATAGLFAWSTVWVYLVVQLGAGVAAALAFRALNPADK